MKIEKAKISALKLNPANPRLIKDEKFAQLIRSVLDFPQMLEIRPIVVNKQMEVLGGNMRLRACMEAGLTEVPIIRAENLTDDQQREFIIKDNVGFGEWDWSALANEWDAAELADWGLDVPDFSVGANEAQEDDYEMPDEIKTDIVAGDLFEIGPHRLLCGDSTRAEDVERLIGGGQADLVFTSPPYNTGGFHPSEAKGSQRYGVYPYLSDDDARSQAEYLQMIKSVLKNTTPATSECANLLLNISYNQNSPFEYVLILSDAIQSGWKMHETIVWKKSSAMPLRSRLTRIVEFVFLLSKYHGDNPPSNQEFEQTEFNFWEISNANTQTKHHAAAFPVELPLKGIGLFCTGDSVLDPFLGSGTTMVAAHQLGRKCYGMEIEPKYCQVIVDRMLKFDPTLEVKKNGQPYAVGEAETV